jgi:GIY-YIG catalytic domain
VSSNWPREYLGMVKIHRCVMGNQHLIPFSVRHLKLSCIFVLMGFIYLYESPSGKFYVGQTVRTMDVRKKQHLSKGSGCRLFKAAIDKYGFENFKETLLIECDNSELNYYEQKYIREYNSVAPDGYNLTTGGGQNGSFSMESRKKMSDTQKRIYQENEEIRKKRPLNGFANKKNKSLPMYLIEEKNKAGRIVGYQVRRHPNNPKVRKFCDAKNPALALQEALEYMDFLNSLDKPMDPALHVKKTNKKCLHLPKYVVQVKNRRTNEVVGYHVNAHQIGDFKSKSFRGITLEDALQQAIDYRDKCLKEKELVQRLDVSG